MQDALLLILASAVLFVVAAAAVFEGELAGAGVVCVMAVGFIVGAVKEMRGATKPPRGFDVETGYKA